MESQKNLYSCVVTFDKGIIYHLGTITFSFVIFHLWNFIQMAINNPSILGSGANEKSCSHILSIIQASAITLAK